MKGIRFQRHIRECLYIILVGKYLLSKKQVIYALKEKITNFYYINKELCFRHHKVVNGGEGENMLHIIVQGFLSECTTKN